MTEGQKPRRLLVIDDEPEFRQFVRRVAEGLEFEVQDVGNGHGFKDIYEMFDPRVIVLVIVMPEIDGIELVQWLGDQRCQAPILLISGYNPLYPKTARVLAEAKGLVSLTTMSKPVNLEELRAALSEAVS